MVTSGKAVSALIARFKQISTMKLYVPGRGDHYACPALAPALTRPVRWDVIENNYDLMMKYATAIRLRTASTEALLRRFTSETTHPAYAAMLEVGRAQRSIFLARWLRDRDLQRETESGLNVVENYNGVTTTSASANAASSPPTGARSKTSGCCACTSCKAASA